MAIAGGVIILLFGLAFILFGLYQIRDVKRIRGRQYSSSMMDYGIPFEVPADPPVVAGGLILLLIVGLLLLIVGSVVLYIGATTKDGMYPFNYGTAFPVHTQPGVLDEEVIGNLL